MDMLLTDELQAELSAMITHRFRADGAVEFSLPYSTLTDKFASVFLQPTGTEQQPGWLVTDGGRLYDGDYEVKACVEFHTAALACGVGYYIGKKVFGLPVTDRKLLTSALFDMAQFIQLAVNLAYLQTY